MNEKDKTESETLEEKIQAVSTPVTPASPEKAKSGIGWKISTIILVLIVLIGCGGACYLFFVDNSISLLGRTITSSKTTTPSEPDKPAEDEHIELQQSWGGDNKVLVKDLGVYIITPPQGLITNYEYNASERYGNGAYSLTLWYYSSHDSTWGYDPTPDFATKEGTKYGLATVTFYKGEMPADASLHPSFTRRQYVGTLGNLKIYVTIHNNDYYNAANEPLTNISDYNKKWLDYDTESLSYYLLDINNYKTNWATIDE